MMAESREAALKRLCDFLSSKPSYRPKWATEILKRYTLWGAIKKPMVRGAFEMALRCGAKVDSQGRLVVLDSDTRMNLQSQPVIAYLEPFQKYFFSSHSRHQGIFGNVKHREGSDVLLGNPHTGLSAEAEKGRTGRWGKGGVSRGGRPRPRAP